MEQQSEGRESARASDATATNTDTIPAVSPETPRRHKEDPVDKPPSKPGDPNPRPPPYHKP